MQNKFRGGAFALGVSAMLFAIFPLVRPFFPLDPRRPSETLEAASAVVTSPVWFYAHMLLLIGFILLIFGIGAIFRALESTPSVRRQILVGAISSCLGIGLILPMLGIEAYALPIIGDLFLDGRTNVSSAIARIYTGPAFAVCLVGLLLLAIGSVFIAISVWRSGRLPKTAGIIFAIGLAAWFPAFPEGVRIVNGLLIGVGGLWLAWRILKDDDQGAASPFHDQATL